MNDKLRIKIADISKTDVEIEFYAFKSGYYEGDNLEDIIPLSTYYYETLKLCFEKKEELDFKYLDDYIEDLEKLWYICDNNNIDLINEYSLSISRSIRDIIREEIEKNKKYDRYIKKDIDSQISNKFESLYNNHNKLKKEIISLADSIKYNEIEKYYKRRDNCVAIALPVIRKALDDNNCYIAFSGAFKDYYGELGNKISPNIKTVYNMIDVYNSINDMLYYVYGVRFNICKLTDSSVRYTYYDSRIKFDRSTTDGRILSRPVKFVTDYRRNKNKYNFEKHYSCCEKKIVNAIMSINYDFQKICLNQKPINKLSSYEIRIKYMPCRMCRPALAGCYNIQYYYHSFNDLISTNKHPNVIIAKKDDKREPLIVNEL